MSSQAAFKSIEISTQDQAEYSVRELDELDYWQALTLLMAHPLEGVHLESLITDYGLTSPGLRGRFYGYFKQDQLKGLALMGHQVMFCAPNEAIRLFAHNAAASGLTISVIFGPAPQAELFWQEYAVQGQALKRQRSFYWYVCAQPAQPIRQFQLVQAMPEHLNPVMEAHASTLIEATGTDPRQTDPTGFRQRVLDRIERGRTWIKLDNRTVIFKAELQSVTPDAIYLEGIWTDFAYRGQGIARECVVELTHRRLRKQQVLCLAVEPQEAVAMRIYEHAGFHHQGNYQAYYPQALGDHPSPMTSS